MKYERYFPKTLANHDQSGGKWSYIGILKDQGPTRKVLQGFNLYEGRGINSHDFPEGPPLAFNYHRGQHAVSFSKLEEHTNRLILVNCFYSDGTSQEAIQLVFTYLDQGKIKNQTV